MLDMHIKLYRLNLYSGYMYIYTHGHILMTTKIINLKESKNGLWECLDAEKEREKSYYNLKNSFYKTEIFLFPLCKTG